MINMKAACCSYYGPRKSLFMSLWLLVAYVPTFLTHTAFLGVLKAALSALHWRPSFAHTLSFFLTPA